MSDKTTRITLCKTTRPLQSKLLYLHCLLDLRIKTTWLSLTSEITWLGVGTKTTLLGLGTLGTWLGLGKHCGLG